MGRIHPNLTESRVQKSKNWLRHNTRQPTCSPSGPQLLSDFHPYFSHSNLRPTTCRSTCWSTPESAAAHSSRWLFWLGVCHKSTLSRRAPPLRYQLAPSPSIPTHPISYSIRQGTPPFMIPPSFPPSTLVPLPSVLDLDDWYFQFVGLVVLADLCNRVSRLSPVTKGFPDSKSNLNLKRKRNFWCSTSLAPLRLFCFPLAAPTIASRQAQAAAPASTRITHTHAHTSHGSKVAGLTQSQLLAGAKGKITRGCGWYCGSHSSLP